MPCSHSRPVETIDAFDPSERLKPTHCGRSHRNEGVSAQRGLHACSQL
jgi:hypothetical protein